MENGRCSPFVFPSRKSITMKTLEMSDDAWGMMLAMSL